MGGIWPENPLDFSKEIAMKRLILWVAALAMLQGGALFGQSLVGTWQGPLQVSQTPGDTLRVVFKISATTSGVLYGDMYSIDQGGHAAAPDVTLKGSAVKIAMPSVGATYVGKLSGDGNSITGSWTGANGGLTLHLTRATAETAWKIPQPPPPPRMMPADADPAFEVATIKLSNPDQRVMGLRMQGRQFSSINLSVSDLILFAFGIHPRQLLGAPEWIEKERYDVLGKPDVEGQPNNRQMRALIQKLLADRFSLKFHREKRELSVYLIVVGKTGAKLTTADGDPKADPLLFFYGPAKFNAKNTTMADFAGFLQRGTIDRPVLDQTGLTGRYDFGLLWKPEVPLGGPANNPLPPSDSDGLPDIYTAIQQQLGLRLEATKTPTEVIVIDHLEKPSEN
jgi:uncharacterized protein (TIGR03435 family)